MVTASPKKIPTSEKLPSNARETPGATLGAPGNHVGTIFD